ncbi:Hypothetical protein NTJ_09774 [Nesidiocoris tenuis]|uniref:Uncharacterized protein n=1 Tax=Nesidiocoris tenuis TaxID=355587 RepID=A0ABN7B1D0_9HEMI|nr:Hypothetical protein NTJ_09774 [Nesidiocoris tenuis]
MGGHLFRVSPISLHILKLRLEPRADRKPGDSRPFSLTRLAKQPHVSAMSFKLDTQTGHTDSPFALFWMGEFKSDPFRRLIILRFKQ